MAKLHITREHRSTLDVAKERIRNLVESFQIEYAKLAISIEWDDDMSSAQAKGRGFKALFDIDEHSVKIFIDLSLIALPLKGRITMSVNAKLDEAFG